MTARRKPLTDAESEPLGTLCPRAAAGHDPHRPGRRRDGSAVRRRLDRRDTSLCPGRRGGAVQRPEPRSRLCGRPTMRRCLIRSPGCPDVEAVGLANPGMALGLGPVDGITTDCGRCAQGGLPTRFKLVRAIHQFVSPDTFRALGTAMVEGRGFTDAGPRGVRAGGDREPGIARRDFEGGRAVGRKIMLAVDGRDWYDVIGIVARPPGQRVSARPSYRTTWSISACCSIRSPRRNWSSGRRPGARARPFRMRLSVARSDRSKFTKSAWRSLAAAQVAPAGLVRPLVRDRRLGHGPDRHHRDFRADAPVGHLAPVRDSGSAAPSAPAGPP